jgi:mono/diheme cytochrome c family protein
MAGLRIGVARVEIPALAILVLALGLEVGRTQQAGGVSNSPVLTYADQGWSAADRDVFYTTSQGSHMMPFAWFNALRRLDMDQPFSADQLQRYGYLPNPASPSNPESLPVGFVIDGASGQIGMTCAACHTAQMEYQKDGMNYVVRLDGAPANADFQQLLTDLNAAASATLTQSDRLDVFTRSVLGSSYSEENAARLKDKFRAWVEQFSEFMQRSLPSSVPWGPGRLDAFGMIFNRVAARDLGITSNFKAADAPVRYPFLWNASRQDHTQWNGGVPNGLYIQALGRNTGEVFGVFADFTPHRDFGDTPLSPALIDYSDNSANFANLQTLEEKIAALRPPPWPREISGLDDALVERGKPLFERNCGRCHSIQQSDSDPRLWRTPVLPVDTDPRMSANSRRISESGPLSGALMPPPAVAAKIGQVANTADILAAAVVGSLFAEALPLRQVPSPDKLSSSGVWRALRKDFTEHLGKNLDDLFNPNQSLQAKLTAVDEIRAFANGSLNSLFKPPVDGISYESRVLQGIWATAPYLHNGSVPNLWELLKPANQRMHTFMVGSRVFDPRNVGYRSDLTSFNNASFVTDPTNSDGNGNGGHEFGTTLSEEDRWAIIEYMKTL